MNENESWLIYLNVVICITIVNISNVMFTILEIVGFNVASNITLLIVFILVLQFIIKLQFPSNRL